MCGYRSIGFTTVEYSILWIAENVFFSFLHSLNILMTCSLSLLETMLLWMFSPPGAHVQKFLGHIWRMYIYQGHIPEVGSTWYVFIKPSYLDLTSGFQLLLLLHHKHLLDTHLHSCGAIWWQWSDWTSKVNSKPRKDSMECSMQFRLIPNSFQKWLPVLICHRLSIWNICCKYLPWSCGSCLHLVYDIFW